MIPKFSVIIPLYNKEKYIKRAINSVLNQTVRDFELVIVNDASTDDSLAYAQSVRDERIRIINHSHNMGVSSARNTGAEAAKSEIVAFLDADDEWIPDFLETISGLIHNFPSCGLFATSYLRIHENNESELSLLDSCYSIGWEGIITDYFYDLAVTRKLNRPYFSASTVAISKKKLQEIGGFPIDIPIREDINTWIRLSLITSFAYKHVPGAIIHLESEKRSNTRISSESDSIYNHANFLRNLMKGNRIPAYRRRSASQLISSYSFPIVERQLANKERYNAIRLMLNLAPTRLFWRKWVKLFIRALLLGMM